MTDHLTPEPELVRAPCSDRELCWPGEENIGEPGTGVTSAEITSGHCVIRAMEIIFRLQQPAPGNYISSRSDICYYQAVSITVHRIETSLENIIMRERQKVGCLSIDFVT